VAIPIVHQLTLLLQFCSLRKFLALSVISIVAVNSFFLTDHRVHSFLLSLSPEVEGE